MEDNKFSQFGPAHPDTDNEVLDWDDEIVDSGSDYPVFTPGNYDFTVLKLERKHYAGGAKMPPCPQAQLTLRVHSSDQGETQVTSNLFLVKKQEWKLAQFFVSLGLMEKGGKLHMDWSHVIGASGRLELSNREYNNKKYNDVAKFLAPEDKPAGSAAGYKAGTF